MSEVVNFIMNNPLITAFVLVVICANIFMIGLILNTRKQRFYARHGLTPIATKKYPRYHPNNRRTIHGH